MKVVYPGQPGSYTDQAVCEFFPAVEAVSCPSLESVFDLVGAGACETGLIPIENSLTGGFFPVYDLLQKNELFIVGETILRIRHCLIAHPGAKRDEIRRVSSHPHALSQCARYLRTLRVETEEAADTAVAVQQLSLAADPTRAAIGSRWAAGLYKMEVLEDGIDDDPGNYTRFLALAKHPVAPDGDAKTSISFTLENQPGALFEVLKGFSTREINILKIVTRPIAGEAWGTTFFMDFVGSVEEERVRQALAEVARSTLTLRVFGSYPRRS